MGKLNGIKVGLMGDLANGRTVRSLAYLLAKYKDVKIYFVSPDVVKMKVSFKAEIYRHCLLHDILCCSMILGNYVDYAITCCYFKVNRRGLLVTLKSSNY